MAQTIQQAILTARSAINKNRSTLKLALFNSDGTPYDTEPVVQVTTGSAIGTVAKSTNAPLPRAGSLVAVKFTNGNSANEPTLAFATGGAKAIKLGGTASAAAKIAVAANGVALFFFDGTTLNQVGVYS